MMEPLRAAAVADDLSMLDFIDHGTPRKPYDPPAAARRNPSSLLLLDDLLDSSVDSFSGFSPPPPPPTSEDDEEQEELEWLADKDAFPSLETSFDFSAVGGSGASPVSVLPPSFKVPVKARTKLCRKRRRIFAPFRSPPPPLFLPPPPPAAKGRQRCWHCAVEETPQWRMGPEGPKTLCNACGVRFKKGRLFPEYRPANSPTFAPGVHSNSTRRIMEMRTRGAAEAAGGKRPGKRGRPPRMAVL